MKSIKRLFDVNTIYLILFIAISIRTVGSLSITKWPFIFIALVTYLFVFKKGQDYAKNAKKNKHRDAINKQKQNLNKSK